MAAALTTAEAREILRLRAGGMGYESIAKRVGRAKASVRNVCDGISPHGDKPHRTAFYRARAAL